MSHLPLSHVLRFWGKTAENRGDKEAAKPVLHHLLDVAAVAHVWLSRDAAFCRRIAGVLRLPDDAVPSLLAFMSGLHDLGKFSAAFQAKSETHWPRDVLGDFPEGGLHDRGHWRYSAVLMYESGFTARLERLFPAISDFGQLIGMIAGHHGRPPSAEDMDAPTVAIRKEIPAPSVAAAQTAGDVLERITQMTPQPELTDRVVRHAGFLLNGIITICDWIGSDTAFFPVRSDPQQDIDCYWKEALCAAEQAILAKGLVGQTVASSPGYDALRLSCAGRLRPMQEAAETAILDAGAHLFIIEDTTGSGKTEAALMLAARLMAAGKGEGFYFALPTMATANAIHDRLAPFYENFFEEGAPSLVLAHGKAALSRKLSRLCNENADRTSVAAYCNSWISDRRKLALLADAGAGTIDQAFLGVLGKRHLTLRQTALARRILIIDEAHSFDTYMGKELETLLEAQARNGGSAIVLSATLSRGVRHALAAAFTRGLRAGEKRLIAQRAADAPEPVEKAQTDPYPLLSRVDHQGVEETSVKFDQRLRRSVRVERLADRPASIESAVAAAKCGAAVAVICNAVDEAIFVHTSIAARLDQADDALLFHARFAVGDRMAIEARVMSTFGPASDAAMRRGKVLVATQVVEQSLDLDFDCVISDLAPIDLLIQRAGRLWRHMEQRPRESRPLADPVLQVVSPDPACVERSDWLDPVLGKAAYVYRNPAVMWRSAHTLFEAGAIRVPDDLREMIERVYSGQEASLPPALESVSLRAQGEEIGQASLATFNLASLDKGYLALGDKLSNDEDIGTRLGEKTVTIRLAQEREGTIAPWFGSGGGDRLLDWALSEITLRENLWVKIAARQAPQGALIPVRVEWPDYEQAMPVLVLPTVHAPDDPLTYNAKTGLSYRVSSPQARG